ncbi:cellulose synthase/poly-beta-1,6-N-acetylglucosamine synthase-like glycosyltransferase [Paenibacillus sp. LBL]|uniref:glycosyltransferase family 2 protein n=1 Tax=Paenibacillus sp. LBL TaxID=2940563 RepID=UPI0024768A79|nr:glycosyltransferase family 2 protein [Paenibacillus sp. LBL]MDH6674326.1 cellulose synthase/poly-beta-1,6-N-acetylglucosamine synthase-like glycosyltransferase [Paenibacillus sp. LBL]
MTQVFVASFTVLQWFLLFFWAYWLFISLFGFGRAKKLRSKLPEKRFLIMIPAHNEEAVIGNLVENLNNLDYPKHLYTVCVIADNCSDNTALIGRKLGAMVIEHTSKPGEAKGKPYGIKYAIDVIGDDLTEKYDAIAIFDADNLVTLNYLEEMNKHLLRGDRLIQCYLDTKNPDDNWVTLSYATSYYYMNRSWQLAKSRLGLGNAIGGTGFCVETKLLQEVGWTAKSLTEDLEFTMQCLLRGVPAKWSHHAKIFDEKPTDFIASCIQRLRWARGHWDVCFKYTLPLMKRFVTKLDLRAFDGALYLINPGKIVLGSLTVIVTWVCYFADFSGIKSMIPLHIWLVLLTFNMLYIIYTIASDAKKKVSSIAKAIVSLFVLNYTYVPLFAWALITKDNKTWKRTEHSRNIAMDEIDLGAAQVATTKEVG